MLFERSIFEGTCHSISDDKKNTLFCIAFPERAHSSVLDELNAYLQKRFLSKSSLEALRNNGYCFLVATGDQENEIAQLLMPYRHVSTSGLNPEERKRLFQKLFSQSGTAFKEDSHDTLQTIVCSPSLFLHTFVVVGLPFSKCWTRKILLHWKSNQIWRART